MSNPESTNTHAKFCKLRFKKFVRPSKHELYITFVLAMLVGFVYDLINMESRISPSRRTLSVPSDEKSLVDIDSSDNNGDGPTFVFVMGTEGTGHHFINSLLAQSPNMKKMKQIGVCASGGKGELHTLSSQFFNTGNEGRLFNPNKRQRGEIDADRHYELIVDTLQSIRTKFNDMRKQEEQQINENESSSATVAPSSKTPFHIAINANSCGRPTMMSYPNLPGPDRSLQNFNLDIFYNACNDAHVQCKHIYIYRDPYDVIKSTTINRVHNSNVYDAIRLYTSVMQQIHSQMISNLDHNIGCFGFLDAKGYQLQQDWERFGMLFGWTTLNSFMTHVKSIQKKDKVPITPMSDEMKMELVPPRLSVLMRAFEDVHKRVHDLCYSSLQPMTPQQSMEEERALATNNNEHDDPMAEETVEESTEELNKENNGTIGTKETDQGRGMTDEKVQFLDNIITSL